MNDSVVEQVRHDPASRRPAELGAWRQSHHPCDLKHLLRLQANQARLLATAEVARLLANGDDLKRVAALREDVLIKQQVDLGSAWTMCSADRGASLP